MRRAIILTVIALIVSASQLNSQSVEHLQEINKVWAKFYQAFETLDYQPMAEIHSRKLIRISGGKRISDYNSYIEGYQRSFKNAKDKGVSNKIELRFFERINNDSVASERGIYQLVRTDKEQNEKTYYGQFHVLFVKENGQWKILMDYDSDEGNTIDKEAFLRAYAIDNLRVFVAN